MRVKIFDARYALFFPPQFPTLTNPQLLEAMVERAPPRGIIDEFGMEAGIQTGSFDDVPSSPVPASAPAPRSTGSPLASPISPTSPRANGAGRAFPLLRGATS